MVINRKLPYGDLSIPPIGQGIGDYAWEDSQCDLIREGTEMGMRFIDTAECYDNGRSEEIVGKALDGIRENAIIATKFSAMHHRSADLIASLERSLRRLRTDYIDVYQMHWPNPDVPLEETLTTMEKLVRDGKIRYIGLGNIYVSDLIKTASILGCLAPLSFLQMEYNLFDRFIENEILPWCRTNEVLLIAYSPLDQGRVVDNNEARELLKELSDKYMKTPAQICLRWLVSDPNVIVIPKSKNKKHLHENVEAVSFDIEPEDFKRISHICKTPITYVDPELICVSPQGERNRKVYQSLEEALLNNLGHVPSPRALSLTMAEESCIKPVRVVKSSSGSGYEFDLVEGRIRYWAWVIARGNMPIPVYVRQNWLKNKEV